MSSVRFAFTVDDVAVHRHKAADGFVSFSSVDDLRELIGFLDRQGVPGTFFVVPFNEGIPLYERPDYVAALRFNVASALQGSPRFRLPLRFVVDRQSQGLELHPERL